MVKFVHMADVHLGYRQYGCEERLVDFAQAFMDAVNYGIKNDVDFIIIAGDLFHKRSEMDPITLTQATKVLEKAKQADIPVVAVEGNHDSTYFRDSFSWMDYLAKNELLINLKPSFDDGLVLEEWNGESGAYVDLDGARIYGMKYYGSLTSKILEEYQKKIKKNGFTIFTAHAGIEGYMNIYGCIPSSILHQFKKSVDYVALGHIHQSIVEDDFIFNPGSLETCDLTESSFNRGIFYVEWNDKLQYQLVDGFAKRKFVSLDYEIKNNDFHSDLRKVVRSQDCENAVVHLKVSASQETKVQPEEIQEIIKEFDPLVVRLKLDTGDTFQPLSSTDKDTIEKNVVEQLLENYNYGNIAEEVLRLKNIFSTSFDNQSVDHFVESILYNRPVEQEIEGTREPVEKKPLEEHTEDQDQDKDKEEKEGESEEEEEEIEAQEEVGKEKEIEKSEEGEEQEESDVGEQEKGEEQEVSEDQDQEKVEEPEEGAGDWREVFSYDTGSKSGKR
ncbi:MAG: DNA repair exonuclease [Archaeoglobaceae archaeon]